MPSYLYLLVNIFNKYLQLGHVVHLPLSFVFVLIECLQCKKANNLYEGTEVEVVSRQQRLFVIFDIVNTLVDRKN
jgi:hypothetical protein